MNTGDFKAYEEEFKRGTNDTRYLSFEQTIDAEMNEPNVDYTSYASIGYLDGYKYGILLARSGRSMDMKSLEAEIDKCFTHAIEKHTTALNFKK